MVHPGIVVASVFGVVVTGVVIYTILKEELNDFLDSFEKPSLVGGGYQQPRDQQQHEDNQRNQQHYDDFDFDRQGQSSSMYQADYELRQRRFQRASEDDDEDKNMNREKSEPDHTVLAQKLRKLNADEARLAEMERSMKEREENLKRSMLEQEERLEQELRESIERNTRREQELASIRHQQQLQQLEMPQSSELYQNPFASNEPLIRAYNVNDSQHIDHLPASVVEPTAVTPEVNSRAADAILCHNLSSNHQENVNPFADPSSLLGNASPSSVQFSHHDGDDVDMFTDAEDRSVTVGHEGSEDLDWTEAETGSIGSHESDESWLR
ncbi:hypothetical protein EDD11_001629 [Mortierella claussenii]|nr:hypothetical protein EDD11_001629 [Mortierella claussenii]